jgi:dTDP-4-amino-4,6-dideoxygalactose transaminase
VTRPSLAPLEEVTELLRSIWESGVMTHHGPLVQRLEKELEAYLDVPNVVCMSNGTNALSASIRALDLEGEIITTPFTFVATANVIRWERCRPVFVDVDPHTWNLDPDAVAAAITPATCAILPVHVFSRPCEVERIDALAADNGLSVIYDAAHAMCVERRGSSLLRAGTVSAVSFHATKLLNTAEGGACVTDDDALADRLRRMRFFGFDAAKEIVDEGTNFKMTEVNAALGLANLRHLDAVRASRRRAYDLYRERLAATSFVTFQRYDADEYNHSYLPVVFDSEERLLRVITALHADEIYPRRYFHPALHTVAHFGAQATELPVAERIARTVLCLPLFDGLADADVDRVCELVAGA